MGVEIIPQHVLSAVTPESVTIEHAWSAKSRSLGADTTSSSPQVSDCSVYRRAQRNGAALDDAGIKGLFLIGDAHTPNVIARPCSQTPAGREIDSPDLPSRCPSSGSASCLTRAATAHGRTSTCVALPPHIP